MSDSCDSWKRWERGWWEVVVCALWDSGIGREAEEGGVVRWLGGRGAQERPSDVLMVQGEGDGKKRFWVWGSWESQGVGCDGVPELSWAKRGWGD